MSNPYTLVFGQSPIEKIERNAQLERIVSEFSSDRPSNYLNLITGIRGSGKTVFLTTIANVFETKDDWIVVNLNSQRDLLNSLAAKLTSNRKTSVWIKEAKINLSAFGLGMEIQGEPQIFDIEVALNKILKEIKKRKQRVLVTIDEVSNSKEMRIFASAYQLFLREDLPVFLLLSGLYKNIDSLRNAEGMTFLERAPRTVLSPLLINAMAENYVKTLKLPMNEAMQLAKETRGYSFAFQTIGYFAWENASDMRLALKKAKEYLYEFSYQKIWTELSAKDRQVVIAMGELKTNEVMQIRKKLNYSSNQFNPYRNRLLKAGVVMSDQSGVLEFALPWFGEFAIGKFEHIL